MFSEYLEQNTGWSWKSETRQVEQQNIQCLSFQVEEEKVAIRGWVFFKKTFWICRNEGSNVYKNVKQFFKLGDSARLQPNIPRNQNQSHGECVHYTHIWREQNVIVLAFLVLLLSSVSAPDKKCDALQTKGSPGHPPLCHQLPNEIRMPLCKDPAPLRRP